MAWILIPRLASARNMVAATPAWLFMPTPTTEILATSSSASKDAKPMASRAFSRTSIEAGSCARGTVKVTSVLPSPLAMFCTIMSTLILASANGPKMPATTPGLSGTPTSVTLASPLSATMPAISSCSISSSSSTTSVPGASEKLDSTCTTTFSFMASSTDRVCNTLAPTLASSSISS